jgi:hypothetical protein
MKNIPTTVRDVTVTELEEKRRQAVGVTFGVILKIEVVVRNQSLPHGLDVCEVGYFSLR